jgi:hypothetical protein
MRLPFEAFRASLSLDAEGRRAGLYRAAGVGALDLYEAKLRAGRLVGGVPLFALFGFIAVLDDLSPAACALLAAVGVASWEIWPRVELLPGLASPHFAHEHPDELGTHHEQQELSGLAEGAGGAVSLLGLALLALLLGARGERFCLLGHNGAGKSTLLRLIVGLSHPSEGSISVLGQDPAKEPDVRRRIGYLSDQPHLYDKLTGEEHLRLHAALYRLSWEEASGRGAGCWKTLGWTPTRESSVSRSGCARS